MKKYLISFICILCLLFSNLSIALADSTYNSGIKFIGDFKQMNSFYDGDAITISDFIIDGKIVDDKNNIIDLNNTNVSVTEKADISNNTISYNIIETKDISKRCSGNININVYPFDSKVNYKSFSIEPMVNYEGKDLSFDVECYLGLQIDKINFTNGLGKKLDINWSKVKVDTSNLKTDVGVYTVSYEIGFYTKNLINRNQYDLVKGTFEVNVLPELFKDNNYNVNTINKINESFSPTLTATALLLDTNTTYDINVDNKLSGSTYYWYSDNTKIAKVNSKNGIVTAVSEGTTKITCKITKPNKEVLELVSNVIVGLDENNPALTETELDLSPEDKFDINVSNKIAKSKYSWRTSNKEVAKVNSKNGIVTAVSKGEAVITCTIITPDNQVIVLRCDVIIE